MSLPHALMLHTQRSQNMVDAAKTLLQAEDAVIEITEHKKENGVAVGIFIEDIRDLQQAVRTAKKNQRTAVIVSDAAKLTVQAQNALLKMLEEPRDGLHFILATPTPNKLLATIRSRCQLRKAASPTSINLPAQKKQRIEFMAGSNLSEQQKLASDSAYYEKQEKLFELGKQFLTGSNIERLAVIASVKESRDDALGVLHAALVAAHFILQKQFSPEMHTRTRQLLRAEEALEKNGNVRLWLLSCVV